MKLNKYILTLLAGATVFTSCKKSFLDETPPTAVNISTAIKTESDLGDAVNGMYNAMRQYTLFGRDIPVLGDELADNAYITSLSNSGRYTSEQNYTFIATNAEASDIWTQGYYVILQANRIIYAANQLAAANGGVFSNNVNQLKGEAYTARALTYLELQNFFATPYTVDANAVGVPIVTNPAVQTNVNNAFVKPSRNTSTQVYTQIISDLDSAFAIMPATIPTATHLAATGSEYAGKYAAKAIESRAYLYKGDYANARDAALAVINGGGYKLTTSDKLLSYWASAGPVTDKTETIFELALNTLTNNGTNGLDYFYSPNGYGDLLVYTDLYNLYSSTDARKGLIIAGTRSGQATLVNNKYSNVLNNGDKDDIKIIRYAEVLLTAAEGYARNGDNVNALKYLNQVAIARDPSFAGYPATDAGTALINDILLERRKELAFEGLRYFDLTRTNSTITRPAQTNRASSLATIAPGDSRRILPIPQAEVDANPNIKQNPGY